MTARRKVGKSIGSLADSGTVKTKRDPPCPSARCRCGHLRLDHEGPNDCTNSVGCDCTGFVLAKPKKPAVKKRKSPCGLLPYIMRSTQIAHVVGAPSVQQIPKLPTKAGWALEGPSPAQVQSIRKIDGSRDSGLLRDSYWEEQPCRFSGNGHEGCFVAPVNRHGGPCLPCWARARQRMQEQKTEIAKLKGGST